MFGRTILFGFLLFFTSAIAQDDAINRIVEGTQALEAKYRCQMGEILNCLVSAGFECESTGDEVESTICSSSGRPVFKIYEQEPKKWIVEVLLEIPKTP